MSFEEHISQTLNDILGEIKNIGRLLQKNPTSESDTFLGATVYLGALPTKDACCYCSYVLVPGRPPIVSSGVRRGSSEAALLLALKMSVDSLQMIKEAARGIHFKVVGEQDFQEALGQALLGGDSSQLARDCREILGGLAPLATVELVKHYAIIDALLEDARDSVS